MLTSPAVGGGGGTASLLCGGVETPEEKT